MGFRFRVGDRVEVRRSGKTGPWIKTTITHRMVGLTDLGGRGGEQYQLKAFGKNSGWYPESWLRKIV